MVQESNGTEKRVLILPPTARDGEITRLLLTRAGLRCVVCNNLPELTRQTEAGASTIVLTEEVFTAKGIDDLLGLLDRQPSWSDLPVIMLMRGAAESPVATRVLMSMRNVTLLERPAPVRSMLSAVRAAVRGRERQYEIRRLLQSERDARAEAERAGRMKDEFLATLSHELRTPLNAILGWSQLIRRGEDKDVLEEGLAVIERNTRVQVQLIEDLLDMSRIVSGKIRLDVQQVDAQSFIDAAIETVQPAAEAKGIRLEKVLDPQVAPISGDPNRLQQVVWNLLSNAIKFTPRGGKVQVLLERVDSHLELNVADTGQGIPPEFLPHVFERFRQADASTTRVHSGLGLGLAIVKHLVELHGGTVRASSAGSGKGSTFTVSLPRSVIQRDATEAPRVHPKAARGGPVHCENTSLKGKKILVVDDEPDARGLIKRLLEECEATVITAGSAAQALLLLPLERPDVLVSDIGMPGTDGYDFLKQVRALGPQKGGRVPAIALTAFARSEDRTRALLAGFLVHLSKPVEPQELVATVATVAGRTGNGDESAKNAL